MNGVSDRLNGHAHVNGTGEVNGDLDESPHFKPEDSYASNSSLHEDVMAIWSFYQYFSSSIFIENNKFKAQALKTYTAPTFKQLYSWFKYRPQHTHLNGNTTGKVNGVNGFAQPNVPGASKDEAFPNDYFLQNFFRLTHCADVAKGLPQNRQNFHRILSRLLNILQRRVDALNDDFYQPLVPSYTWHNKNHLPWWQLKSKKLARQYFQRLRNSQSDLTKNLQSTNYENYPSTCRSRVFRELCEAQLDRNKSLTESKIDACLETAYATRLNKFPHVFTPQGPTFQIRELGYDANSEVYLYLCGWPVTDFVVYKFLQSKAFGEEKTNPVLVAQSKEEVLSLVDRLQINDDSVDANSSRREELVDALGSDTLLSGVHDSGDGAQNTRLLINELNGVVTALNNYEKQQARRERTANNRLKKLETWDMYRKSPVSSNGALPSSEGDSGRRKRNSKIKSYCFEEYDEQIDLALGIIPTKKAKRNASASPAGSMMSDGSHEDLAFPNQTTSTTSRGSPAPYGVTSSQLRKESFRVSRRLRGIDASLLNDESSRSSISSTDTESGPNNLFVQLPPSPTTEQMMNDLSGFDL